MVPGEQIVASLWELLIKEILLHPNINIDELLNESSITLQELVQFFWKTQQSLRDYKLQKNWICVDKL
jgi:hypothetical protein